MLLHPSTTTVLLSISFLLSTTNAFILPSRYTVRNYVDVGNRNAQEVRQPIFVMKGDEEVVEKESSSSTVKVNTPATPVAATGENDLTSDLLATVSAELSEVAECASLVFQYVVSKKDDSVIPEDVVKVCDKLDEDIQQSNTNNIWTKDTLKLRQQALKFSRYHLLIKLMKQDYDAYIATASFLSPSRIPRMDLPNVQDVPFNDIMPSMKMETDNEGEEAPLVDDCTLDNKNFNDSLLDKVLLRIFRNLVTKNTGGVTSEKEGILGLLEQGRLFMLQPAQTAERQNKMVYDTLTDIMTPALPPFYRIFMTGIVPKLGTSMDGKQLGPWFYAPWLTSLVTPTVFGFLVGPSYINRRKDGERGGLVVEKCKFLQESGCKGLCLQICKIPAQQVFAEELGLPLTVSPNFATQECQWSFGEVPLPHKEDPSFPKGCLKGCESRTAVNF